ncbi:hypothetical protein C7N43_15010 [Sphingobacteriales bacterium UPWRP_1]|nr:hypothetical protein C7N43_15010 [Sphingobacteriales bacterium UPWRP_1]
MFTYINRYSGNLFITTIKTPCLLAYPCICSWCISAVQANAKAVITLFALGLYICRCFEKHRVNAQCLQPVAAFIAKPFLPLLPVC